MEWQDAGGWVPSEHKCVECGQVLFLDADRGLCEACAKKLRDDKVPEETWLNRRTERALERISQLLPAESAEEGLKIFLDHLGLYFGADRAAVDLYNPKRDLLEAKIGIGIERRYLAKLTFPRDGSPLRNYSDADSSPTHEACLIRCFRTGRTVIINQRQGDPAFDEYSEEKRRYEAAVAEGRGPEVLRFLKPARAFARSFVLLPLKKNPAAEAGEIAGLAGIYRLDNEFWNPFRPEEVASLERFAAGVAPKIFPA